MGHTPKSPDIPSQKVIPAPETAADTISLVEASQELIGFASKDEGNLRRTIRDWQLRFWLKILLFVFVLAVNVWWDRHIQLMLWRSGATDSKFHLDNSVLITLASTSIANFLALVIIVARHLFPDSLPRK